MQQFWVHTNKFNLMQTNIFPIEMKHKFLFSEYSLKLVNTTLLYMTPLDITAHFCETKPFCSKLPLLYDHDTW